MEEKYEDAYAAIEERHPWFVARRELFERLHGPERDARILDVGCGTGMFLVHLAAAGFRSLAGVEKSAQLRARFRDPALPVHAELPGAGARFDSVFMLDVLEHIEDDRGTLARIHALLEPGGRYFVSVPAHPFLWSRHDDLNHHVRRYTRRELVTKLAEAGFELERLSYWNCFSFLPICATRALRLGAKSSELELGSRFTFAILGAILRFENWLLRFVNLPMGVSLIAVLRKPK